MDTLLFRETQHMTGSAILVAVIAVFVWIMVSRYGRMRPLSKVILALTILLLAFTCVILFTLKLETAYYMRHIEHRYASFFGTAYAAESLDSVTSARIITYNPSDYGGWGEKGNEKTVVFNASGNKGILFTFSSGRRLLLGTRQPDTLYARLKGYYPLDK